LTSTNEFSNEPERLRWLAISAFISLDQPNTNDDPVCKNVRCFSAFLGVMFGLLYKLGLDRFCTRNLDNKIRIRIVARLRSTNLSCVMQAF
jgi:hypothetical protein